MLQPGNRQRCGRAICICCCTACSCICSTGARGNVGYCPRYGGGADDRAAGAAGWRWKMPSEKTVLTAWEMSRCPQSGFWSCWKRGRFPIPWRKCARRFPLTTTAVGTSQQLADCAASGSRCSWTRQKTRQARGNGGRHPARRREAPWKRQNQIRLQEFPYPALHLPQGEVELNTGKL